MISNLFINLMIIILLIFLSALVLLNVRYDLKETFTGSKQLQVKQGYIGTLTTNSANKWIKVADFSLSRPFDVVEIKLKVFGNEPQTFLLKIQNEGEANNFKINYIYNEYRSDANHKNLAFSRASLSSSGTGLETRHTLYLKMNRNKCYDIPVVWYIRGFSLRDMYLTGNMDTVPEQLETELDESVSSSQQMYINDPLAIKIEQLSTTIRKAQNVVGLPHAMIG